MSYCSPIAKKNNYTCFDIRSLRKIATAYNNTKAQTGGDRISFDNKTTKKQLWKDIRRKLNNICFDNEWCWIDQDFVQQLDDPIIHEFTFRPPGPMGNFEWLRTSQIYKVMKQYEKKHPEFIFFGPVPIDFQALNLELNKLDLAKLLKKGKTKIGVVYNMDPHDKPGSHWVALFIDLNEMTISYYDSFGESYPVEIQKFINKLNKHAIETLGRGFRIEFNNNQHQYGSSECGIYSIYFILRRLQGDKMDDIINGTPRDNIINDLRKVFFRPSIF